MELCKCRKVCHEIGQHSPILVCDYHMSTALKKNASDPAKLGETVKEGSFELPIVLIAVGALMLMLPCMMHKACKCLSCHRRQRPMRKKK